MVGGWCDVGTGVIICLHFVACVAGPPSASPLRCLAEAVVTNSIFHFIFHKERCKTCVLSLHGRTLMEVCGVQNYFCSFGRVSGARERSRDASHLPATRLLTLLTLCVYSRCYSKHNRILYIIYLEYICDSMCLSI